MTMPTPEEFLSTLSNPADEEVDYPSDPASLFPHPDTLWQVPEPDYLAQIASDVRALRERFTGTVTDLEVPTVQEITAAVQGFTPSEAPIFNETSQPYVEQIADLEAEKQTLTELVEQIAGIVKPSKSQVSLEVKAAIGAWKNPQVESELAPDVEPAPDGGGYPIDITGTHTIGTISESNQTYCQECSKKAQEWVEWPCPTANTEEYGAAEAAVAGSANVMDMIPPVGPTQPAHDAPVADWRTYAKSVAQANGADVAVIDTMNRSQIRTALGIEQPSGDSA